MIFLLNGIDRKQVIGIGTNDERLDRDHLAGIYSERWPNEFEGYYTYNGSVIRAHKDGVFVRYLAQSQVHICPITRMVFAKEDEDHVWYMLHKDADEQEVWEYFEEVPRIHREEVKIIGKETATIIKALKSRNGPVEEFMGNMVEED